MGPPNMLDPPLGRLTANTLPACSLSPHPHCCALLYVAVTLQLVARESRLSSMTQSLEVRQHTLDAKDAQINQHAKHLAHREAAAAAREASLAAASKDAEARHWAAVAREQQVQEAAGQVMAQSAQLDAREQQLRQLQALLVAGVTAEQLEVVGQALRQLQI